MISVSILQKDVSRTPVIELRFSQSIQAQPENLEQAIVIIPGTVGQAFLSDLNNPPLSDSRADDLVAGRVTPSEASLTFEPASPLEPESLYTLVVSAALRDFQGYALGSPFVYEFVTGGSALGAPQLRLRFPENATVELPRNLDQVVVEFSEPVSGVEDDSLAIVGAATTVSEAASWCPTCYALNLLEPLGSDQTYQLWMGDQIRDAKGNKPFTGEPLTFTTESFFDQAAPLLGSVMIMQADRCLVARWITDEPATSELLRVQEGPFVLIHEVGLAMEQGPIAVSIAAQDWAFNRTEQKLGMMQAERPPEIRITEILANPVGPEPAQEWVELANLGDIEVDLTRWRLADSSGSDELPMAVLEPGEIALVVGQTYDALEGTDPPPHPQAKLIRLESAIGAGGLRNSGEPVRLLDSKGQVVSSYSGHLDTSQGQSAVRIGQCDIAESWVASKPGEATPGLLE